MIYCADLLIDRAPTTNGNLNELSQLGKDAYF
jgi:hypothetical protein